ncbi:hypothetical protein FRC02_008129 [Tulasnella sp. 418]|nr:hypothetical protein FRC02_008129 [Tulasnella sp. 418]
MQHEEFNGECIHSNFNRPPSAATFASTPSKAYPHEMLPLLAYFSVTVPLVIAQTTSSASFSPVVTLPATSTPFTPLASKRFQYTALPYKVDTDNGERGTQFGYNICNATTEGPTSLCQTAMINSLEDFCLWGPPEPNSLIGDTEGEAVAWCTKPGRGTRLIPQGALTGVQFMRTPDYVQVTGRIRQELINIAASDSGGEMDPHGADRRGNPLGGILFSNAFPSNGGNLNSFQQVVEWHNFMGDGLFCLKACDPAGANDDRFCEHIYDRIGCWRNAPAAYAEGVFETCDGDNQDFPGIYTGSDGVVSTYSQPPESLGPITTVPYDPKIPASSNCVPGVSSVLYPALPSGSIPGAASSSTPSAAVSRTSNAASSRATTSAAAASTTSANTNSALIQVVPQAAALFGALLSVMYLV